MHELIISRDGLECPDPIEFEYHIHPYHNAEWFKATMCVFCAGSSRHEGIVDEHLRVEWKSLLPVCQTCRGKGALPLTRTRKRNGLAKARGTETTLLKKDIRDELEAPAASAEGAEANQPARASRRQVQRRNHRPFAPNPSVMLSTHVPIIGVQPSAPTSTSDVKPSAPARTPGV
jgi:hypothetical protein